MILKSKDLAATIKESSSAPWMVEDDGIFGKTPDGHTIQLFEIYVADDEARAEANLSLISMAPELAARLIAVEEAEAAMQQRCAELVLKYTVGTSVGAGDGCGTFIPRVVYGPDIAAAIRALPLLAAATCKQNGETLT